MKLLALLAVPVIFGCCCGGGGSIRTTTPTTDTAPAPATTAEERATPIHSMSLAQVYKDNALKARGWTDTLIITRGIVHRVHADHVSLYGTDNHGIGTVDCFWSDSTGFEKLRPSDTVIIRGRCRGKRLLGGVRVTDCVLDTHGEQACQARWAELTR